MIRTDVGTFDWRAVALLIILNVLLGLTDVRADTFGTAPNEFGLEFVLIGAPGNPADDTSYGAVPYSYRIGKHEVSERMIEGFNDNGGQPSLNRAGWGFEYPVTTMNWNQAARFVNWINTSEGYSPAYKFTTQGATDNIELWAAGDPGYDPQNPFRNRHAYYFLPSHDEWYKAAYFDPAEGGRYFDYPTGSDSQPGQTAAGGGLTGAVWNWSHVARGALAPTTNAGGLSPFGTMAQGGNVSEFLETASASPNNDPLKSRVIRGGRYFSCTSIPWQLMYECDLHAEWWSHLRGISPSASMMAEDAIGFRVASHVDSDNDGEFDAFDEDDDGDGVPDASDAFPVDPLESVDTDGDGTGNNADLDDDNDGLTDSEESQWGTNPLKSDSDDDGVSDSIDPFPLDGTEWTDSDGDGLGDNADPDDDDDGFFDAVDAFPLDPNEWLDTDGDGIGNNEDLDDDGDGLSDAMEATLQTDPLEKDSDGDGLDDPVELAFLLNPLEQDTDGDGILDAAEDEDEDTLTNAEEHAHGTSPFLDDTDGDGLRDGEEAATHGTDPTNPDSDNDLLEDGVEVNATRTDPLREDSDNDGTSDADEDSDGDGFTNIQEVEIFLTNPGDSSSRFWTEFAHSPTNHSITFLGLSGRRYRVERSVDLDPDPTKWSEVITFVGTGAVVTIPLGVPFSQRWFYRVVVSLD